MCGWAGDEPRSKVNDRALPIAACRAGPDDTESRTIQTSLGHSRETLSF